MGHARLFGVLLWDYETHETGDSNTAKFSRNKAISRTHNYRLLKEIIENNLLIKEGNGYYSFAVRT